MAEASVDAGRGMLLVRRILKGSSRKVLHVKARDLQAFEAEFAQNLPLIGSPPGYLGHRETHAALSQHALNQHFTDKVKLSFVLFDEIEKASDALWNLLLGLLDKGTLTLGDNSKVDFSATMIFMTSNLGAAEMSALVNPKLGFRAAAPEDGAAGLRRRSESGAASTTRSRHGPGPGNVTRISRTVGAPSLREAEVRRAS